MDAYRNLPDFDESGYSAVNASKFYPHPAALTPTGLLHCGMQRQN